MSESNLYYKLQQIKEKIGDIQHEAKERSYKPEDIDLKAILEILTSLAETVEKIDLEIETIKKQQKKIKQNKKPWLKNY